MMVRYKNNHSKSKTTTTLAILIRFISNNNKAPLHITRMCVSPRAHAPALLASEPWGRRGVKYNLLFSPRGHAGTHGACDYPSRGLPSGGRAEALRRAFLGLRLLLAQLGLRARLARALRCPRRRARVV